MKRDYRLYIDDIIAAMEKIRTYSKEMSFEDFSADEKVVDATIRNFEVIGEAVKHLPSKLKKRYPNIPWKTMAGMRDKLIHEYFGVNKRVLWRTIKEELPPIEPLIRDVLKYLDETAEKA